MLTIRNSIGTDMRKWHRWISLAFGVFLLFIASTGLLSHLAVLWPAGGEAQAAGAPAAFVCPDGWRCRPLPPQTGIRSMVGLFHHLHSGETFGPAGTAISILSGLALLFFSVSGLWMYLRMWRERARRGARERWFWR
jgi:uncharacterized iron-regulated membrane protein